VKKLDVASVF